jgi:hypothetical protein
MDTGSGLDVHRMQTFWSMALLVVSLVVPVQYVRADGFHHQLDR